MGGWGGKREREGGSGIEGWRSEKEVRVSWREREGCELREG